MANHLNLELPHELHSFIHACAGENGLYATPEEYIRDLIRCDMAEQKKQNAVEIATMLTEARTTDVTPLESDFFAQERAQLHARR